MKRMSSDVLFDLPSPFLRLMGTHNVVFWQGQRTTERKKELHHGP